MEAPKVEQKLNPSNNGGLKPDVSESVDIDTVTEDSFDFITGEEGFRQEPYWDVVRYAIGYGTPANGRTYITEQVARQEVYDIINSIRDKWDFGEYDDNIQVALISFTYNLGSPPSGYKWYLDNGHISGLRNRMLEYVYAGDKYMDGLYTRRLSETNLFYK